MRKRNSPLFGGRCTIWTGTSCISRWRKWFMDFAPKAIHVETLGVGLDIKTLGRSHANKEDRNTKRLASWQYRSISKTSANWCQPLQIGMGSKWWSHHNPLMAQVLAAPTWLMSPWWVPWVPWALNLGLFRSCITASMPNKMSWEVSGSILAEHRVAALTVCFNIKTSTEKCQHHQYIRIIIWFNNNNN